MIRELALLLALAAPAHAEPMATVYLDNNVAAYQFHFFDDADLDLVPDGVDLNTRAITAMANVVVPFPIPRAPIWLPYASAGLGAVHAMFDAEGAQRLDRSQTNLAFNAGIGMKHRLTELVGLQLEGRYFRVLVDDESTTAGFFQDYNVWRVSVGVTFGFPTALPDNLR